MRLLIALALLCGCKRDPVIVIRFDSDMGARKATVDAAEPAASKPSQPAAPPSGPTSFKNCKTDADCVAMPEDCCDCAHGGKQVSMSKMEAKAVFMKRCLDVMCTQMMSTHPSCAKTPACVAGQCALK